MFKKRQRATQTSQNRSTRSNSHYNSIKLDVDPQSRRLGASIPEPVTEGSSAHKSRKLSIDELRRRYDHGSDDDSIVEHSDRVLVEPAGPPCSTRSVSAEQDQSYRDDVQSALGDGIDNEWEVEQLRKVGIDAQLKIKPQFSVEDVRLRIKRRISELEAEARALKEKHE